MMNKEDIVSEAINYAIKNIHKISIDGCSTRAEGEFDSITCSIHKLMMSIAVDAFIAGANYTNNQMI